MTNCLVCGGPGRPWVRRADRELLRCAACGFAWVPQGVLRTASGSSIYEDEAGALFEQQADYYYDDSAREAAAAKAAWVGLHVPAGRRLLDVGANVGDFVAQASAFDALGIEPSPVAVRIARERGITNVVRGSIDEPLDGRTFDAVTLFDVIEHLADPRRALERCRELLAANGRLFLTTPDSGSLVARLLGSRWYYLDLDQHISIFSADTLTRLLADTGFEVVARRTFGRGYRLSYVERRLRELGRGNAVLRAAGVAAWPLRLAPDARVRINLGDVMGLVAAPTRGA